MDIHFSAYSVSRRESFVGSLAVIVFVPNLVAVTVTLLASQYMFYFALDYATISKIFETSQQAYKT